MQVPIRKGGEFTNLEPDPYLTQVKFNELQNKLNRLKTQQPGLIAEVKRLAEMGDFSENAAYQMAKGKLRGLNEKIDQFKNHLKMAIIIEYDKNSSKVQLGSHVTIKINHRQTTYQILGSSEIDLAKNIISHNSPLGSVLIGKQAGEKFSFELKEKIIIGKIISLNNVLSLPSKMRR